jgi:hypothetical protein
MGRAPQAISIMVSSNADFETLDFHEIRHEQYATQGYPKAIVFSLLQSVIKTR